jgi:predicted metal-dependent HD superfamily phosphohydrolase
MNGDWRSDWLSLCNRLHARGDCANAGELLVARYGEVHRAYHNLEHIEECLAQLAPSRALALEPDVIELAIWFHDAVYDPRAGENEEQSAKLAREFCCTAHLPSELGERTAALILVTKTHLPGDDADAQLLVDIDLSILGQSRDRFARYEDAIRQEYCWVPDAAFREGRSAVLGKFLAREWIYSTALFRDRYEEAARANLRWSLARLAAETARDSESGSE